MTDLILAIQLDHRVAFFIFFIIVSTGILTIAWPALQAKKFRRKCDVFEEDVPSLWRSDCHSSQQKNSRPLLSIIIPAYNEQRRLPSMLASTLDHLNDAQHQLVGLCQDVLDIPYVESHQSENTSATKLPTSVPPFELIIINDGSKDSTISSIQNFLENRQNSTNRSSLQATVRILTLQQNSGKGAAIRTGMLHSSAHFCLMADADGATEISSGLPKLLQAMASKKTPVAFGSRAHLQQKSQATRTASRTILMHGFHFFVKVLCSNRVQDTQCGFKLFTHAAAQSLFGNLHLTRWAFDTELIVIAERLHLGIAEVGVEWREVEGSKLDDGGKLGLAIVSLGMLRDMLCVRVCYSLGFWAMYESKERRKLD